jgi:hypothetical protein
MRFVLVLTASQGKLRSAQLLAVRRGPRWEWVEAPVYSSPLFNPTFKVKQEIIVKKKEKGKRKEWRYRSLLFLFSPTERYHFDD